MVKTDVSPDGDAAPTIAVIVTNMNYSHFLAGCIDCALAQTTRPDEIIVVDDGSTDGSLALLADYADRVEIVRQPNGGQASAFNAGFARSTSSIVLFLDADDLLRPEAIETIKIWWRPGLTSLSFWLELIDIGGRGRGIYEETLRVDEGDKRQRLITRGVFAFAPTSGNAFSRAFLKTVLPLDETRWRISADLPLTYAAALHGPHAVIPQALGAYRTHGNNSYYRERLPDVWRLHRGMRDVVDALGLLADRQQDQGRAGDDAALLGLALRFAALRMRVKLQNLEGNRGDLARYAGHQGRAVLASRLPMAVRLVALVPFAALALGGWRSAGLRGWIADPRERASMLAVAAAALRERRPGGVLARMARLQRPRWHALVPYETAYGPDFNGLAASIMAEGWSGEMSLSLHWTRGPKAWLEFKLNPHPHARRLELALVFCPGIKGQRVVVETMLDGRRLTLDHFIDQGIVTIDLSREMLEARPFVRLELACAVLAPARRGWRAILAPAPFFAIRSLRVEALGLPPPFPLLMSGIQRRAGDVLAPEETGADWVVDPDGVAWMLHSEATSHVAVAPFDQPVALCIVLARSEARGWLRITCGDRMLFSGSAVSGAELHCRLAPIASPDDTGLDLVFGFTANDPTDTARLGIATIGLTTAGTTAAATPAEPDQHLRLNIGERVALEPGTARRFASGKGWDIDDVAGLANVETEASFTLGIPPDCLDPVLHLSLEPLLPEPDSHHHVIAVSNEQEVLVSARLQGVGSLDIPVPAAALDKHGAVTMTLHSIFVADGASEGEPMLPLFAGVRVRAASLTARASARHASIAVPGYVYAGSRLHDLAAEAKALIGGQLPIHEDGLRAFRFRLATAIWETDRRGLESHLMVPGFVDELESLGALAAAVPLGTGERALVAAMAAPGSGPSLVLRRMLCSLVLRVVPGTALSGLRSLPAPLLWSPRPLARYLARKPYGLGRPAPDPELGRYRETLLGDLLDILREDPRASALYVLAAEILDVFDPTADAEPSTGFGAVPLLWARCVELHLSRLGCRLADSPPVRRSRPRIGVLIREAAPDPDTGIALGIGRELDRDGVETVLIMLTSTQPPPEMREAFDTVVELRDGALERGVATVRALALDSLLIAATPHGLDMMATLAAHRLAPVQTIVAGPPGWGRHLRSLAAAGVSWSASWRPGDAVPLRCADAVAFLAKSSVEPNGQGPRLSEGGPVNLGADAADLEAFRPLAILWVRVLAERSHSNLVIETDPKPEQPPAEISLIKGVIGMACAELGVAQDRVRFVSRRAVGADACNTPDLVLGYLGRDAGRLLKAVREGIPFVALADPEATAPGPEIWAACLATAGLIATGPEDYVQAAVALAGEPARRVSRLNEITQALAAGESATDAGMGQASNAVFLATRADQAPVAMVDDDQPLPGLV